MTNSCDPASLWQSPRLQARLQILHSRPLWGPRHERRYRLASSSSRSSAGSTDSSSGGSGLPPLQPADQEPWALMGRVVREDALAALVDQHVGRGLVTAAAARHAGLALEDFEPRVQAVLVLMPFLEPKLPRLRPELLAGLAADAERTAARLLRLRALLPAAADAAALLAARPSLLLDGEWERLPEGLDALLRRFSEGDVARLVQAEPSLLLEDVDGVLRELQRLTGAPAGHVPRMLVRVPSLVHSVASGTRRLGPGAEFMDVAIEVDV